MKLKLKDKIRKFFGQAEHQEADAVLDGDVPAYGGSLEVSVANLAALKPSAARHETQSTYQQHTQVQQRPGCQPACQDQLHVGAAAAEKQAASQFQLQQHHGQHSPQIASCTNSQKDAKDFCSGLRTTGQDESYTLQNEVYFPQLLLTLQGGTPEQKAVAAEALFNYTAESDAARQRATQAGVVAHLVDLLRTGTEHGKMYAAYTLSSLTTIDESLEQMHKHGAIPALIDILSTCPLLVCKKGAMRALGRLARSDDAAQEIVAGTPGAGQHTRRMGLQHVCVCVCVCVLTSMTPHVKTEYSRMPLMPSIFEHHVLQKAEQSEQAEALQEATTDVFTPLSCSLQLHCHVQESL
jgi:hypothetical protein